MSDQGLLDTNTLILAERMTDPTVLPDRPLISAITLAELSAGPLITDDEAVRAVRQRYVQRAEADFDPLPFDADCARAFGTVAAALRQIGRKTAARRYDAMIAATAVAHNLPVYTCNPDDFHGIPGLAVVPVAIPAV